jgi:mannosyltransferase
VKRWYAPAAVVALTIIAFLLRLYHLDAQCLTWDEQFTKNLAVTNASYIIAFTFTRDPNPPLYYFAAKMSGMAFNEFSTYAMRFPAAIFGVCSIPVMYLIGKEYRNETLGLIMAFTVAVSYQMIFYGQFARAYTLVFLLFGIATYAYLKIRTAEEHSRKIWYLLFVMSATASLWSHAYAFVPVGLLCLYLLWKDWTIFKWYFALLCLWCLPFIYYITVISNRSQEHFGGEWWQVAYMLPLEILWIPGFVIIPVCAVALYKSRTAIFSDSRVFIGYVALATIVSTVVISFANPIFPRYALLVAPVVMMIGLSKVAEWIDRQSDLEKKLVCALVYCFIIVACSYTPLIAWYYITNCPYSIANPQFQFTPII